jgi:hypothetical protein
MNYIPNFRLSVETPNGAAAVDRVLTARIYIYQIEN